VIEMIGKTRGLFRCSLLTLMVAAVAISPAMAQRDQTGGRLLQRPTVEFAERPIPATHIDAEAKPGEHPLMPALRWAYAGLGDLEALEDYQATLVKRERIDGELTDYEYIDCKIRHKPFSVYLRFAAPASVKGQEVIYIEGQNNGNMKAHTVGLRDALVGTVSLKPTGPLAMQGQRYPLTEIGILNLTRRLVEVGENDTKYGECEVKFYEGAKVNGRVCTCMQFVHPNPRREFRFHLARVFVDTELNLPIRYEAYSWPKQPGGAPVLEEEYTYLNLKLNNGFTDIDWDVKNPEYRFR
jgi:hypothetical protein